VSVCGNKNFRTLKIFVDLHVLVWYKVIRKWREFQMRVIEANIRFMRRIQVTQFEPAEAEVSFKVSAEEGEDVSTFAIQKLDEAKGLVLSRLGKGPTPAPVPTPPGMRTEADIKVTATPAAGAALGLTPAPAAPTAQAEVDSTLPAEEPAAEGAKRGRKPGSKNKPKDDSVFPEESKVVVVPPPAEKPARAPDIGSNVFPSDDAAPATAQATPAAATAASDVFPEETPVTATVAPTAPSGPVSIDDKALQEAAAKAVSSKKMTSGEVKAVIAKCGAGRLADIPSDKRAAFLAEIKATVEGKTAVSV
jgi:hypothetical protein